MVLLERVRVAASILKIGKNNSLHLEIDFFSKRKQQREEQQQQQQKISRKKWIENKTHLSGASPATKTTAATTATENDDSAQNVSTKNKK